MSKFKPDKKASKRQIPRFEANTAAGETRTHYLQFRKLLLYPGELLLQDLTNYTWSQRFLQERLGLMIARRNLVKHLDQGLFAAVA